MLWFYAITLMQAFLPPAATAGGPAVSVAACRKDLRSAGFRVRHAAIVKLGWLGPNAAPALPELKGAMRAREAVIRHDAVNTLVRIGPKAVPALAEALRDRRPEVRWRAAHALLRLGPDARGAVPALAEHVRGGPGFTARVLAAMALGRLGPLARDALPALVAAAQAPENDGPTWSADQPSSVCEAAIGAVRRIDPEALKEVAATALPTLRARLRREGTTDQAVGERLSAARAIALLGPHAVPALPDLRAAVLGSADPASFVAACIGSGAPGQKLLMETLFEPGIDGATRRRLMRSLAFLPGLEPEAVRQVACLLKDPDDVIRCLAAMTLASQGPGAAPAIPALVERLDDPALAQLHDGTLIAYSLRDVGAEALARTGPKAVPALLEALQKEVIRSHALIALGRMGPPAKAAVPALRPLLEGPPGEVSIQAAGALLRIGDDPARPLGTLVGALRGAADPSLRRQALEILAAGGTPRSRLDSRPGLPRGAQMPREAVPALLGFLADVDLRYDAANVLGRMPQAAPEIIREVSARLRGADRLLRSTLLEILAQYGPAARKAVPEILRCLAEDRSEVIWRAAFFALGAIGPSAKAAIPLLIEAAKNPKASDSMDALRTLGKIGAGSKEVIAALVVELRRRGTGDPGRDDRRSAAAEALAALGPAATPALPALREALLDDDVLVRIYATTALAAAGEDKEAYLRLIVLAWRDTYDPEEPYSALPHVLNGIALLGRAAAAAVPRLLEVLDRPPMDRFEEDDRAEAVRALAGIGPAAKAAVPRLRALAATEGDLAAPAAEALRKIEGPGAARP